MRARARRRGGRTTPFPGGCRIAAVHQRRLERLPPPVRLESCLPRYWENMTSRGTAPWKFATTCRCVGRSARRYTHHTRGGARSSAASTMALGGQMVAMPPLPAAGAEGDPEDRAGVVAAHTSNTLAPRRNGARHRARACGRRAMVRFVLEYADGHQPGPWEDTRSADATPTAGDAGAATSGSTFHCRPVKVGEVRSAF